MYKSTIKGPLKLTTIQSTSELDTYTHQVWKFEMLNSLDKSAFQVLCSHILKDTYHWSGPRLCLQIMEEWTGWMVWNPFSCCHCYYHVSSAPPNIAIYWQWTYLLCGTIEPLSPNRHCPGCLSINKNATECLNKTFEKFKIIRHDEYASNYSLFSIPIPNWGFANVIDFQLGLL